MDLDLNEGQRLLKDGVDRLLAERYDFEHRRAYLREPDGWARALWSAYADFGLLGLPFAEADGGFGGGPVETMIVMEALGRALAVEPYVATVVLAGGLVRSGADQRQRSELIPRIAAGDLLLAFAHSERRSRYDLADVATAARRIDGSWVLDGIKTLVLHGDCAHTFIVSARVSGEQRDRAGLALFIVGADAPGVSRLGYPTQDEQRAADVSLRSVRVGDDALLGPPGAAFPLIAQAVDGAIAAVCAEAVGVMQVMLDTTVGYLKERRQFGVPIGTFQVLQHRAVDMLVAVEQARSMAMYAAVMADEPDASVRANAMAAAKIQIGRSGTFVGQQAIQLHGGIGMTDEYKVGHYFKRMTIINSLFGDPDTHLATLARSAHGDAADDKVIA